MLVRSHGWEREKGMGDGWDGMFGVLVFDFDYLSAASYLIVSAFLMARL